MKPPVETIRVSSKGRELLIQAKRYTGLKQWNELLRWAFCISLSNSDPPKTMRLLDTGIDPIEWNTFAGSRGTVLTAIYYLRARKDNIDTSNQESNLIYFRSHIERGVASLRTFKSLERLASLPAGLPPPK